MLKKALGKITEANREANKQKNAMNPMILLVIIVFLCAIASYIIPAGNYNRVIDAETGTELIEAGSFAFEVRTPTTIMQLLESLTMGMQRGGYVIFFLLIVGGMFAILNGTGALNVGIANVLHALKGKELLMIPILMLLFGCGSAFCGNFEEYLVFVPLVLACCITVGYDSLTAVGIIFIAATAGYAGAMTNAFTVGTAQGIAGLPRFSGMGYRAIVFICLELASIIYVCWYAGMVKKNPELSGAYAYDQENNQDKKIKLDHIPKLTVNQIFVLIVFLLGIGVAVWGIIKEGFYIDELAGIFLATGVIGGLVGKLKPSEICKQFEKGCHDMLLPGIMIGLANAVIVILQNANVMDTILYGLAHLLTKFPNAFMAVGMFVIHDILNIIVPSGSAQAGITMPLMVPLADATGVSRQTAVLAYQLGDAFTNVLAPTGGEILAALAICKVPFGKWLKFLLPLFAIWWIIAIVLLMVAVKVGY